MLLFDVTLQDKSRTLHAFIHTLYSTYLLRSGLPNFIIFCGLTLGFQPIKTHLRTGGWNIWLRGDIILFEIICKATVHFNIIIKLMLFINENQ